MVTFKEQMKGFPVWQMAVVLMLRFCEPISFTSLFPYLYFMIRDFHLVDDPTQISKYTGLLAASFALSQFFCCIHWGRLSDRIGRKKVLLMGLGGTGFTLLVFGFSPNFYVALAARLIAGALNGNIAVMQTLVGEIATERRHQGIAFAMLPLLWNVGCVIGPLIGGLAYLTRPRPDNSTADVVPQLLTAWHDEFLDKYPYALSNVVVATLYFISAVLGFLFLEETIPKKRGKYDVGLVIGDRIRRFVGVYVAPRPWEKAKVAGLEPIPETQDSIDEVLESDSDTEGTPLNQAPVAIYGDEELISSEAGYSLPGQLSRRTSQALGRRYSDVYELQPVLLQAPTVTVVEAKGLITLFRDRTVFTPQVIGTMLAYFSVAFHALIYTEFVPIYLAGAIKKDSLQFPWHIQGGMGWSTQEIGTLLSSVGFVGCILIIVVFPWLDRNVKTIHGFRVASCTFPIAYTILPYIIFTTPAYNPNILPIVHKVFLYCNSAVAVFGTALAFPQITILVYRATKPQHRALVNSTTQSANSLARFIAPLLWGAITSFFDKRQLAQMPWNLLAIIAVLSLGLAFKLDEYNEDLEDDEGTGVEA